MHKLTKLFLQQLLVFYAAIVSCTSPSGEKMRSRIFDETVVSDSARLTMVSEPLHNFGKIQLGDKIRHAFYFKNSGTSPLIISNVSASCGCTVAEFPKAAILPNQVDSVTTLFDSNLSGRGVQNKVITIFSNSPNSPFLLTLVGNVK